MLGAVIVPSFVIESDMGGSGRNPYRREHHEPVVHGAGGRAGYFKVFSIHGSGIHLVPVRVGPYGRGPDPGHPVLVGIEYPEIPYVRCIVEIDPERDRDRLHMVDDAFQDIVPVHRVALRSHFHLQVVRAKLREIGSDGKGVFYCFFRSQGLFHRLFHRAPAIDGIAQKERRNRIQAFIGNPRHHGCVIIQARPGQRREDGGNGQIDG